MRKSKLMLVLGLTMSLAMGCFAGCGSKGSVLKSSVRLENGGIKENSVVIKIGDIGIKYRTVKNYCYFLKQQYEPVYGEKIWDYSISEKETVGGDAKQEIINMVSQIAIIEEEAKKEEIKLTNDEKDEATGRAEEMIENASDEDKKEYLLSVQSLSEVFAANALAEKMFYLATDDADTNVTEEEARQIRIQYIHLITNGTKENGTKVQLSEEEKKKTFQHAATLLKEAQGVEDFASFAKSNSEDAQSEITIGKDSKQIDAAAVSAAFELAVGEYSPVIEGETGYYIIRLVSDKDEDATYARREEIIAERQTEMFQKKYKKWLGDADVDISKSFWKQFEI